MAAAPNHRNEKWRNDIVHRVKMACAYPQFELIHKGNQDTGVIKTACSVAIFCVDELPPVLWHISLEEFLGFFNFPDTESCRIVDLVLKKNRH
jgi:hypothetical protein